jgi:hypothetical protein
MQNMPERVSMETTIDGRVITIRSINAWPVVIFLAVWVSFWTFGGYEAFKAFAGAVMNFKITMLPVVIFLGVWLAGWAAGEGMAIIGIAWMLWGREKITVSQGVLSMRYDVKVTSLAKKFNINEMADISVQNTTVTFKYRNKTESLGILTGREDALKLEGFLRQCLPQGKFKESE